MDRRWSFWIDRGGTFTDVIGRAGDGAETSLKLLSASPSYPDAAVEAMRRILGAAPGEPLYFMTSAGGLVRAEVMK